MKEINTSNSATRDAGQKQCDFCDKQFECDQNSAHAIDMCDDCAELFLRRFTKLPNFELSNRAKRERWINFIRSSLSEKLLKFANDGQRFEAAPDATPDEKFVAAREVLRSTLHERESEKKRQTPRRSESNIIGGSTSTITPIPMTIHYAHINSESGLFVFIRLPDSIEQSKHDIAAWAEQLSSKYFSGLPVVVHNHDETDTETNTTFPPEFHRVVATFDGAGIGLSTMQVEDKPVQQR